MIVYLQLIDTAEDRSKFERLYEQYKQLMFYTAFQILKRPQDAEDAVHHAFLSIAIIKSIYVILVHLSLLILFIPFAALDQ